MKYPQLVSIRAVNAISDWLVSQLEQLGVESAQIYTRLLLSILQTSVQVNDPIEFSNLKIAYGNRKGWLNSKRYQNLLSDTEKLRKLNAIQCLRDIVSTEYTTTVLEQLVDELYNKLIDVENKSADRYVFDEKIHSSTAAADDLVIVGSKANGRNLQKQPKSKQHKYPRSAVLDAGHNNKRSSQQHHTKNYVKQSESTIACVVMDSDPKKRYFTAFPALSKQMEDSFRIWRSNTKNLTWPLLVHDNNLLENSLDLKNKTLKKFPATEKRLKFKEIRDSVNEYSGCSANLTHRIVIGENNLKKRSKRRNNPSPSISFKGSSVQNLDKNLMGNNGLVENYKQFNHFSKRFQRSPSPSNIWDTNFQGCWEMGPDLIEEFLISQKNNDKRNCCISNGDAESVCDMMKTIGNETSSTTAKNFTSMDDATASTMPTSTEEITLCYEGEDLVAVVNGDVAADVGTPAFKNDDDYAANVGALLPGNVSCEADELFENDDCSKVTNLSSVIEMRQNNSPSSELCDQLVWNQFVAKFNNKLKALWNDETLEEPSKEAVILGAGYKNCEIPTIFHGNSSTNILIENVGNFWSNYHQQAQVSSTTSTSSMMTACFNEGSDTSAHGTDIAYSSDYFSMPSNLDNFDNAADVPYVGGRTIRTIGAPTPTTGVFLQNSIWSSSHDHNKGEVAAFADTDEGFVPKACQTNKGLYESKSEDRNNKMNSALFDIDHVAEYSVSSVGGIDYHRLQFPYGRLKWSEGINAPVNGVCCLEPSGYVNMKKNYDYGSNTAAYANKVNWRTCGCNLQVDLQSWQASNPTKLSEMYGSDVCDSVVRNDFSGQSESIDPTPEITLSNHCPNTSGFVAYSRIKQYGLQQPIPKEESSKSTLKSDSRSSTAEDDDVDPLNFEFSHFYPIELYPDGHTFNVNNSLDNVEYERSSSGHLYFECNQYMEYKELETESGRTSKKKKESNMQSLENMHSTASEEQFRIKFRLKNSCEIAIQTEEHYFELTSANLKCVQSPQLSSFTQDDSSSNKEQHIGEAVTPAISFKNNIGNLQDVSVNSYPIDKYELNSEQRQDIQDHMSGDDEVDFSHSCITTNTQRLYNWQIQGIERPSLCDIYKQALDLNQMLNNLNEDSTYSLCAAYNCCNDQGESLPANKLLCDELKLEGDEIMNDLNRIQYLYIDNNVKIEQPLEIDFRKMQNINNNYLCLGLDQGTLANKCSKRVEGNSVQSMVLQFNQFIEELLRPQNTEENNSNDSHDCTGMNNTQELSRHCIDYDDSSTDSLWQFGNNFERRIWQHNPLNSELTNSAELPNSFEPMLLFDSVNENHNEFGECLKKLISKHDTLSKIWQHSTPPPIISTAINTSATERKESECNMFERDLMREDTHQDNADMVKEKNLKNKQNLIHLNATSGKIANYKKIQQFLNASMANNKLKISNRKRRHSSSQNFSQYQKINNNDDDNDVKMITNLDCYQQKSTSLLIEDQYDGDSYTEKQLQTIITCKYWTTKETSFDPATTAMMLLSAAADTTSTNSDDDNKSQRISSQPYYDDYKFSYELPVMHNTTLSYLNDKKSSSLLNEMNGLARPLTR